MFELKYETPFEWTEAVLADFDGFLIDHAAAEKKASGMAMSMLSQQLFHLTRILKKI